MGKTTIIFDSIHDISIYDNDASFKICGIVTTLYYKYNTSVVKQWHHKTEQNNFQRFQKATNAMY